MADLRYFIDVLITVSSTSLGWFQLNKRTPASLKGENRFLPLACVCSVCFTRDHLKCDPQNLFQQDLINSWQSCFIQASGSGFQRLL